MVAMATGLVTQSTGCDIPRCQVGSGMCWAEVDKCILQLTTNILQTFITGKNKNIHDCQSLYLKKTSLHCKFCCTYFGGLCLNGTCIHIG